MVSTTPTDKTAWAVNPCSWHDAAKLSEELGIPQVVAMVLAGRGLSDPAAAREFLECSLLLPDPFLFSDLKGAVDCILAAIDGGLKIVVHGDYDADGITATALMVLGLRALGAKVDWYLPSRFNEGYGLSRTAVEAIVAGQAAVLVTVDCGVNYPDEVALARELGLEVVVVDHHEPGPLLPDCHLIHHVRGTYPHGGLCGVGLALKVMHGLHIERLGAERHKLPAALLQSLDLVAVGTVADLAPLLGENRYYVREGLKLLNVGQRVGLRALAQVSSCAGAIDSGSVAFRLAPRLNAAGRLSDPSPPLRLLLTDDEHEAKAVAARLHELNGERQDLEKTMFDSAQRQVAGLEALPSVLVLAAHDWHEGVVGIVASRIVEQYQRPAVLLCLREGIAKGSGRSIPAYDLLGGVTACGHLLTIYGGHAQAAGLTMEADKVDEFRIALEAHADSMLSAADLVPTYRADAVLASEELSADTAQALASLEPFGNANPRPRFLLVDTVLENIERTRNGSHMRCRAQVGGVKIQAIGFGMGRRPDVTAWGDSPCVVGAQLKADEWQGATRAQLVLERFAFVPNDAGPPDRSMEEHVDLEGDLQTDQERAAKVGCTAPTCAPAACSMPAGWPSSARDLRDHPGRLTALAQVLATQESVVLLTRSALRTVEDMRKRLPFEVLTGGQSVRLHRGCAADAAARVRGSRVAVVEWDALCTFASTLDDRCHAIVLDPPFRPEHMQAVTQLAEGGSMVHLLYGEQERADTAALLRYLVHPRFAMVCLYQATQREGSDTSDSLSVARRVAWQEAQVALTTQELERAQSILHDLGLERLEPGQAKLDARENSAYRQAEADYEECVRSCLTL